MENKKEQIKIEFEQTFAKHCEELGISKLCRENHKAEQLDTLMFICEYFITSLDESEDCDTCTNDKWSEEDEDIMDSTIEALEFLSERKEWAFLEDNIIWLQSLKERMKGE